jgi:hypothetical protein
MTKYNVTFCKFMNDLEPYLALQIIENLEYSYSSKGKNINARLIHSALKGRWGLD